MSESLRDRVARVLYEVATAGFTEVPSFDDAHEFDKADHYVAADALIAAGLVAEPEWEYGVSDWGSAFNVTRCRDSEDAQKELAFLDSRSYLVRRRPSTDWQEAPSEAL